MSGFFYLLEEKFIRKPGIRENVMEKGKKSFFEGISGCIADASIIKFVYIIPYL